MCQIVKISIWNPLEFFDKKFEIVWKFSGLIQGTISLINKIQIKCNATLMPSVEQKTLK